MAENTEEIKEESLMDKISGKLHGGGDSSSSSSSSDSDSDKKPEKELKSESAKVRNYRLFGREKPVHQVLGGGKSADVFMWKNKKISAGVLGGVTAIWVLFELLEYHLLTLVCYILIFALTTLFIWANATTFINKSPPHIRKIRLPEDTVLQVAQAVRIETNRALAVLREIACGRDLKMFLAVIAGLWVLSFVGSWFNFLTLFYIAFVLLHTVPVLYDAYEDKIDPLAEKATIELKKQYAVVDAKVLSRIPKGPFKDKKKV